MTEVRAADLRFTPEEASAFLNDVMGLALGGGRRGARRGHGGWIAALQLAALSMRDRQDTSGFVESFSGSNRHVLDFLAEEVLERQPEGVREFLLKTSVLERMSASCATPSPAAMMGSRCWRGWSMRTSSSSHWTTSGTGTVTITLRRRPPFTLTAGTTREDQRAAPPGGGVVRAKRLDVRSNPARAGSPRARSGGRPRRAGGPEDVVPRRGYDALGLAGGVARGNEGPSASAVVPVLRALLWVGQLDDVEPLVREIERAAGVSGEGPDEDLVERGRARPPGSPRRRRSRPILARLPEGRAARRDRACPPSARALAREGPGAAHLRGLRLAEAYRTADDLEAASAAFAETAELGRAAGHDYLVLRAMSRQAKLQMVQGRLRKADHVLRRALRFAVERGGDSLPATGEVHVVIGELLYEWNQLEAAERRLKEGIRLAERMGQLDTLVDGYVALSRRRWRGAVRRAPGDAQEASRLAERTGAAEAIVEAAAWNARLHLTRGDLTAAVLELERIAGTSAVSVSMVRDRADHPSAADHGPRRTRRGPSATGGAA